MPLIREGEVSMVEKMSKGGFWQDQLDKIKTLSSAWISILTLLSGPTMIIPCGIAVVAFYAGNMSGVSKEVSLILNIIASVAAAVAGGFAVEWWNKTTGNTIVVKKGQSAVRNLLLIREKAKNAAARTRSESGSDEIENLLGLLEKDLGNSIKDWNDILPAVVETEALYAELDEKERENDSIRSQLERLKADLEKAEKERTLTAGEKEDLKKLIAATEEEAAELREEIKELKSVTATSILKSTTSPQLSAFSPYSGSRRPMENWDSVMGKIDKLADKTLTVTTQKVCKKCGKLYNIRAIGENGLCPKCNRESK